MEIMGGRGIISSSNRNWGILSRKVRKSGMIFSLVIDRVEEWEGLVMTHETVKSLLHFVLMSVRYFSCIYSSVRCPLTEAVGEVQLEVEQGRFDVVMRFCVCYLFLSVYCRSGNVT